MDIAVKRFYLSLYIPVALLISLWLVFLLDHFLDLDLYFLGIYPRKWEGLQGVIFSPFIHGSLKHIIANSFPILVLTTALFYFYRDLAFRVLFIGVLMTNVLVWLIARPSYHIGASGLIYSLAGFLFLSGVLRKHVGLMALSLIIVFQYGSLVWGIFPLEERVSWEGHLMGLVTGFLLAWLYRRRGPQKPKSPWELEDSDESDEMADDAGLPWQEYELEGKRKEIHYDYITKNRESINNKD